MMEGANVLLTCGADIVTESVSLAEQMPDVHEVEGFVFVTLAGGMIVAALTTCVWAIANVGANMANSKATSSAAISCTDHLLLLYRNALAKTSNAFKNNTPNSLVLMPPNDLHQDKSS